MLTSTPFWSVILVTMIDFVGFLPTLRKSLLKPFEETLSIYVLTSLKFFLALLALQDYSVITALYPAYMIVVNLLFVAVVRSIRARQIG